MLGEYEQAIKLYRRVMKLDRSSQVRQLLGFHSGKLLLNLGRFEEAITEYELVLQVNPRHAACVAQLAVANEKYRKNRNEKKGLVPNINGQKQG
jgi:tetratricopeptide (TPR) repeat protein